MAKLVCVREGRAGYHVGDIVEVPGEPDAIDPFFDYYVEPDGNGGVQTEIEQKEAELAALEAEQHNEPAQGGE